MNYRIKFLSLWSSIMAEERWHKFDSQACVPSCKGWNAWAPLCECGKNYKFRQGLHTHRKSCKIINNFCETKINNENPLG
jgi:hypothetical protein